jgi:deoxyribonuclease-1
MNKTLPLLLLLLISTTALAEPPQSFSQAKKIATEIYADHQVSFYCGCSYARIENKLTPDLQSCGYKPRKEPKRASRIEWEHVVPAWAFGHQLQCWQDGGRKNCRKTSEKFRLMEADLMNLVPAIGEINGNRSNYSFAMLEGEPRVYGKCDFEVDFKARKVEPAPEVRGDIARVYWYMRDTYGLKISDKQQKLFEVWSKLDPVSGWETERTGRIESLIGFSHK